MNFFFGAWPPAATAAALEAWAKALEGRVTAAQKIHLTLACLGRVAAERASGAARSIRTSYTSGFLQELFELPELEGFLAHGFEHL